MLSRTCDFFSFNCCSFKVCAILLCLLSHACACCVLIASAARHRDVRRCKKRRKARAESCCGGSLALLCVCIAHVWARFSFVLPYSLIVYRIRSRWRRRYAALTSDAGLLFIIVLWNVICWDHGQCGLPLQYFALPAPWILLLWRHFVYRLSFVVYRSSFLVSRLSFLVFLFIDSRLSFLVSRFSFIVYCFSFVAYRFSFIVSRLSIK